MFHWLPSTPRFSQAFFLFRLRSLQTKTAHPKIRVKPCMCILQYTPSHKCPLTQYKSRLTDLPPQPASQVSSTVPLMSVLLAALLTLHPDLAAMRL